MATVQQWHTLDINDAAAALDTDTKGGLSTAEAENRLGEYGTNELTETGRRSRFQILLDQFADIMLLML
ncbi:MAG: cation-transporting P-type ATPase, partial [Phormidesmis sp.]